MQLSCRFRRSLLHGLRHFHQSRRRLLSSSVLRFDEMTGSWVVFSQGRKDRPRQISDDTTTPPPTRLVDLPQKVKDCPFCVGNEHLTTEVLLATESMRVVPNKYPAVAHLGGKNRHKDAHDDQPDQHLLNNEVHAVGFHEVVIESPLHNVHLATTSGMSQELLAVFAARGRAHREFADIEHTVFFKNHGATAGASMIHPHSQIVSTPVVPVEAERLQSLALSYYRRNRGSLYERIVQEEIQLFDTLPDHSRVVEVSDNFLAIVPYASQGPYVVTILPRFDQHSDGVVDGSDFTSTTPYLLEECASMLQSVLRRLHILLDEPCFNLVIQTSPVPDRGVQAAVKASAFFRWHVRLTPRLGQGAMAGFELGSGFFSNTHMPECDALELRSV